MSEKKETDSVRFSQVLAGALAAVTAAVLGSTMGVAGSVIGAGLASVVTTVGGALYLRSIQRTKERVRTVRDIVVARAGGTSVTLVEEKPAPEAGGDPGRAKASEPAQPAETAEQTAERTAEGGAEAGDGAEGADGQTPRRRMRLPALIAASVLAFVLGMSVVTGLEWLRGESLSGDDRTTVGGIVRSQPDTGDERDQTPPATPESTTPETGVPTVTVTETPPTSDDIEPTEPPAESSTPEPTPPDTTTGGPPSGSASIPEPGEIG